MDLLLSCEHATNAIPARYRPLFESRQARAALRSHRGSDIGALRIAQRLQRASGAPLYIAEASRLLVDLNRSLHHRRLFSEFSIGLDADERARVVDHYYRPYREIVERHIERHLEQERGRGAGLLHISVHSFTPQLDGHERNADVAWLYDPARTEETAVALALTRRLRTPPPGGRDVFARRSLRVRRNYPYRGTADGLTTALRRRFADGRYLGLELELNQGLLSHTLRAEMLADRLAAALQRVLSDAESV